jgi:phenylalanyl-tRNA synthetase beta chain
LNKAKIVLNTVVTMFSQYCKDKFSVEPVNVVYSDHQSVTPDLSNRIVETSADYLCKRVGVKLSNSEVVKLLGRMGLLSQEKEGKILVTVPPTRSDILHACDIAEDVAIGYGFNNVLKTFPRCNTIAAPFPLNKLSDQLRLEVALSGFTEVLPLILCSHDENFAYLRKQDDGTQAVKLANPKTVEYQVVRTSLIPGMLKTIQSNRSIPLPMKLFEVSDVVFKNDAIERRARNQRNFCAIYCGKTSGFEVIHGLLDRVMKMLNIANVSVGSSNGYYIQECEDATFFKGRTARIYLNQKPIGTFGILHPEVLKNFDIANPCSVLEMTVEPFV